MVSLHDSHLGFLRSNPAPGPCCAPYHVNMNVLCAQITQNLKYILQILNMRITKEKEKAVSDWYVCNSKAASP